MVEITKDMTIEDTIRTYPDTADVFFRYGFHCLGCHGASFETIEMGAVSHGMSEEQVNELVKELNEVIKNSEKEE